MPEIRSKIPPRVGILLSDEMLWEVVFIIHQIDLHGFMRLPIIWQPSGEQAKGLFLGRQMTCERLGRIEAQQMEDVRASSLMALIVFAGKNEFDALCNFEQAGPAFGVDQAFRRFLRIAFRRGLPIGAFGYAVPLVVKAIQGLTKEGPVVTVGNDPKLHTGIEAAGGQAVPTRPTEVIIDHANRLVTCGGQLATNRPTEVAADCENMFKGITELMKDESCAKSTLQKSPPQ